MTTMTPPIAPICVLSLSGRPAARYATRMPKKHDDPLYTVARYTTAQAAAMLGVKQIAVQTAIKRGLMESELASPRTRSSRRPRSTPTARITWARSGSPRARSDG